MKTGASIIILLVGFISINLAQNLADFPCYSVATNNGLENVLFKIDGGTYLWNEIGLTGTNFVEAIAIDGTTNIIYAAEGSGGTNGVDGVFGTIDPTTGVFTAIGTTGTGNGAFGAVNLNNIDGMSFDQVNQIMYATHRIEGEGSQSNDLFFQIDVSTGGFVPNAMIDDATGMATDYVIIPEIFDEQFGGYLYDVEDIAYNSYTGQLYALHNQNNIGGLISVLDTYTGFVEEVPFDFSQDNLRGLNFNYLGELYSTTQESLLLVDFYSLEFVPLSSIDQNNENTGFESFDCRVGQNDLALTISLDAQTELPLQPGDFFTCNITIHNQGDLDNFDIMLANYLPEGLTLEDANWSEFNRIAFTTIREPLNAGASTSATITLKIDITYNGDLITNSAEIVSSFSPYIYDNYRNPIPLPDVDSTPNDRNEETNILDDEINGGGPNANEDEDDHDIVSINLSSAIPNILNLTGVIQEDIYRAWQIVNANGLLLPSSSVIFEAGESINLNTGFSVESNTFFDATIELVE